MGAQTPKGSTLLSKRAPGSAAHIKHCSIHRQLPGNEGADPQREHVDE